MKMERPREKMLLEGAQSLSNRELLSILIGSGVRGRPVHLVAQALLDAAQGDLSELSRMPPEGYALVDGIGTVKAVQIAAALELGRRRQVNSSLRQRKDIIRSSKDVYDRFALKLADLAHEEFWLLLLRRSNAVMSEVMISRGGLTGTVADPKVIFSKALAMRAAGIVAIHNHPSGSSNPSRADRELTKNLQWAGKMLDCPLLDHLIVAGDDYFSFADAGEL
ncbi:MAG: DNA repair protein RadC [Crocinitomicaceae bacterium]|jgi:DNA repair protein RadC|nr:DNA repair protein RadC [Crocinitomicaceae bacterium]